MNDDDKKQQVLAGDWKCESCGKNHTPLLCSLLFTSYEYK
jgi:hypothetical protein